MPTVLIATSRCVSVAGNGYQINLSLYHCCGRLYVQWFNVVVHFVDIVDSLDFIFANWVALIQDFNSTF